MTDEDVRPYDSCCSLAAHVTKQLAQNHMLTAFIYHWVGGCMLAFSGSPLNVVSICQVYSALIIRQRDSKLGV